MAKRTPRNHAADTSSAPNKPERRKAPRERGAARVAADSNPTTPEELPNIPEPGDLGDQANRSESMASEPSEEDIRLRAYHRYLERGGDHGRHFDDWLEAELELKGRK